MTDRTERPPEAKVPEECSCGNRDPEKWDYLGIQKWNGRKSWAWNCQVCGSFQTTRINW